jgi:uncharacterized protein (TIGR03435 family)
MESRNLALVFGTALIALQGQPPAFEAAAIKINASGKAGGGMDLSPARMRIINSTLKFCVQVAWNVKDFQVSGATGWMDTEKYDIDAVAASPFKEGEYRAMFKALLADRFGVVIRSETQDKPGFALVVAKNGPKLPPAIEDPSVMFSRTAAGDRTLTAKSVTMKRFADALSVALDAIVVDKTGIDGNYDVSFQWTPDPANEPRVLKSGEPAPAPAADAAAGPSIFTALQEKLGLRLESRKVPMEIIVIEKAHRPSDN